MYRSADGICNNLNTNNKTMGMAGIGFGRNIKVNYTEAHFKNTHLNWLLNPHPL